MLTTINATDIDALLPQTQCTKCTYSGCRPYAEAIIAGESINKCHPGGQVTVEALAQLLQIDTLPLDAADPEEATVLKYAHIREEECIGCTKCIQACPVDAILGAAKRMHKVIIKECTGCDLCIEPCPVDCIDLLPYSASEAPPLRHSPDYFRDRYTARNNRLAQNTAKRLSQISTREQAIATTTNAPLSTVLEKLQRNVDGARNRVIHAQGKVDIARQYHPEKLMPLLARLQDLQYKHDEAIKKLAAHTSSASTTPDANYIADLLARAKLARANLTDEQRLARALELLQSKISNAQQALVIAEKSSNEDRETLKIQLKKLTDKLQALQHEISEQKN